MSDAMAGELLVFVEDTIRSLSVVVAAGAMASSRHRTLRVVHVCNGYWSWSTPFAPCLAPTAPYYLLGEAILQDQLAIDAKVRTLLDPYENLEWSLVSVGGPLRRAALVAIRAADPETIVIGATSSRRGLRRSFERWLATRTRVPIAIVN
jgi:hypothetical protein